MTLQGIKPGDIVECDVRGHQFYAVVEEKITRALKIKPITANVTYFEVKSTEVKSHYRKAKS